MDFPRLRLPLAPPFPPMEALSAPVLPRGAGWQYEPKWDGFRCLVFRDRDQVLLQSKSGQPLTRYFPELVEAFGQLPRRRFVLDGEIVIVRRNRLVFDDLLQRIHPAASRVQRLAAETPAVFIAFDLLLNVRGGPLTLRPLAERRRRLEAFFKRVRVPPRIRLSPTTSRAVVAERWLAALGAAGLDGVMAKRRTCPYRAGKRDAMVKVKRIRSADCVVGGFRFAAREGIGSLLLGLYDARGRLHHVGFTSSFTADQRRRLKDFMVPLRGGAGFSGRAPGGPSRWSTERSGEWEAVDPRLVCEVAWDHFSGGRFRHGTRFLRWRPDKAARQCTLEQVEPLKSSRALARLLHGHA